MIGKIIGAFAGSKLANSSTKGIDGPAGAALGVAAATVAKRLSLPAIIVLGAGGYVVKKMLDKRADDSSPAVSGGPTQPPAPATTASVPPPKAAKS